MSTRGQRALTIVALVVAVLAMVAAGASWLAPRPPEAAPTPVATVAAQTYGCLVYTEQGCAKYVVADGGEIEVQSGGTLDIQSGATTGFDAALDLDSTLNVDGATTLNSTLDVDGNISSGTGAITITDNIDITGTMDVDGAVTLNGALDVDGNISSGTGGITMTDNVIVDGAADEIQVLVQGNGTQTSALQVWEQSDGTDVASLSNAGALDVASTINYGADDLYPLGYAASGYQLVFGAETGVTDTITAAHGLTTVTWAMCTLAEDPDTDAGDPVACTVEVAANVVVIKLWQDDWSAGATAAAVNWLVVGQ